MVINQGDVFWVDLDEKSGTLPRRQVRQILDGVHLVVEPRDVDE